MPPSRYQITPNNMAVLALRSVCTGYSHRACHRSGNKSVACTWSMSSFTLISTFSAKSTASVSYVVTTHRFLHTNMATGTSFRALLQPFSVRPIFFIFRYQSFQVLLPVAPLHRFAHRRRSRRFHVFDDEPLCDLDGAIR